MFVSKMSSGGMSNGSGSGPTMGSGNMSSGGMGSKSSVNGIPSRPMRPGSGRCVSKGCDFLRDNISPFLCLTVRCFSTVPWHLVEWVVEADRL